VRGAKSGICRLSSDIPRERDKSSGDAAIGVDFLWREQRLIAEVDGWDSHRSRSAFEQDRARDAQLAVLGYEVVRFTWRQLTGDPAAVATTIRALISARPV